MGHHYKKIQNAPPSPADAPLAPSTLSTASTPSTSSTPSSAVPGWWGWAAAVAGGLAGAMAFDPAGLRPLIVLAPLGCFLALRWAPSPRGALLRAWAFGWVYFFGALQWLLTIRDYAPFPALGVLAVIALGLYLGVYPALAGYVLRKWLWTRCASLQFIMFGSLWLLAEWVRTLGRMAMPLAQLGHAWATVPWAIQVAQWLGELGVSLEVLYLAGLIFLAGRWRVLRRAPDRDASLVALRRLGRIIPALGALALVGLIGSAVSYHGWARRVRDSLVIPDAGRLNVALVQRNIPEPFILGSMATWLDPTEWQPRLEQIHARTEGMITANAHGQWDLILLPETAYPDRDFSGNEPLKNHIGDLARRAGGDLLFCADRVARTDSTTQTFNSAYFVSKDGRYAKEVYDKNRLVPFGENLPYFDMIPGLAENVVGMIPLNEGLKQNLFVTTKGPKFGVLICFESTFSSSARRLVRLGADFLAVVTNDAWYGMSAGAANHHNVSLLRAVETRRWLLRCANTGISSIITPAGTIAVYDTPQGKAVATGALGWQGIVQGTITPGIFKGRTLFTVIGNGWLALPLLVLAWGAWRRRGRLE